MSARMPSTLLRALALAALAPMTTPAVGQAGPEPVVEMTSEAPIRPAIDGIFEAFETHPLVGLGEAHLVSQILDFYPAIIRDPRFAREVGHVVVEFGGAAHQAALDRYLNGEEVPYPELRKVWIDTVGWIPAVPGQGYARFFAEVRQVNEALPPERRITVWLGEPPIDWSQIGTREEHRALLNTRESHAAEVIVRNILAKDRKALVIYGAGHLEREPAWEEEVHAMIAAADPGGPMSHRNPTLRHLVEQQYPGSFFVAQIYFGFRDDECTRRFEQRMAAWTLPALALNVAGTPLERELRACQTPRSVNGMRFPPSVPADVQERVRAIVLANDDRDWPLVQDSVLFIAPARDLTVDTPFLEFAFDEEFRAELNRRAELITGAPLPEDWMRSFPASPVPYGGRL